MICQIRHQTFPLPSIPLCGTPFYFNNIVYNSPGVTKLINKLNGLPFDDNDEHHFEVDCFMS